MKKTKKLIALFLAVLMVLTAFAPACFAVDGKREHLGEFPYPVISVRGKTGNIFAADGITQIFPTGYSFKDDLPKSMMDILFPHVLTGIVTGNFQPYYDACVAEFQRIFGVAQLDGNGNVKDGSGISKEAKDILPRAIHDTQSGWYRNDAMYSAIGYIYDWRLDPYVIADGLEDVIDGVIKNSGMDKVDLHVVCLGGTTLLAYLEKYGSDKIHAIICDGAIIDGSDMMSELWQGNIKLSGDALKRYVADLSLKKERNPESADDAMVFVLQTLSEILGAMEQAGAMGKITGGFDDFYQIFKKNVVPGILLATFGTWPAYWAQIKFEDHENAINYIFNTPELKEEYAGLIEKIEHYQHSAVKNFVPIIT